MLAPSLSTRGTLLKFQALQILLFDLELVYFICLVCPHLALTVSVNKMTPHSTNRVLLMPCLSTLGTLLKFQALQMLFV